MRVRARYNYSSAEQATSSFNSVSSGFALNDATFFFAGPVTKHFTGFAELERPGDSAEIEAVVSAGGVYGDYDNFGAFRLGQFHTITRNGFGGMDRPTGLTTPDVMTRDLTMGMSGYSSGTSLKLNQDQVGLEGSWVHKSHRVFAQILNGPHTNGTTTNQGDDNQAKDFIAGYELLWGDIASGLTAFTYQGVQDDKVNRTGRIRIQRYGFTIAQTWRDGWEAQGGYVWAKDDFKTNTPTQWDITGNGFWVEGEKYFEKASDLTVFARYDSTDPNNDMNHNTRTKWTTGVTIPAGDWHARWAAPQGRPCAFSINPSGDRFFH